MGIFIIIYRAFMRVGFWRLAFARLSGLEVSLAILQINFSVKAFDFDSLTQLIFRKIVFPIFSCSQ
jgi:hypothetical protein